MEFYHQSSMYPVPGTGKKPILVFRVGFFALELIDILENFPHYSEARKVLESTPHLSGRL
jgi:hypothetical protein